MATKKKTTTTTKTPKKAVAKKAASETCTCSERVAELELQVANAVRRINILKDASRMPSSSRDNW